MTGPAYTPGQGYAVVAPGFALVAPRLDAGLATTLWERALGGVGVVDLLELLGADGFSTMPEFASAHWVGDQVRLVVRGACTAQLTTEDGTTTADAADVSTWSERVVDVQRLLGLRLLVAGAAGSDHETLPLTSGVVRADGIVVDEAGPVVVSAPVAVPSRTVEPEAEADPEAAPEPEAEPEQEPEPEVAPEPEPEPEPVRAADVVPDPAATIVEADEGQFDALFGATVMGRKPEDAAVREAPDEPAAAPVVAPPPGLLPAPRDASTETPPAPEAGDLHDHRTIAPAEFARLRERARAATPPATTPTVNVRLTLSTGREVTFERPVLIGRAPQARNTAGTDLPLMVVVEDPYVSGTHLELAVVKDALHATDVSTNGTALRLPGGVTLPLLKGQATSVPDGAVLQLSDELTATVRYE